MKNIGYILLTAGFLAGAFATSLDVQNVSWTLFVGAALAAVAGLVLVKRQASADATSETVLEVNRGELTESIQNIVTDLGELVAADTSGSDLRDKIDHKLRDDLRRFADARQSMVHLFGLQTYADIMSSFATGERYVNRVWSASADDYPDEARDYLQRAAKQFDAAKQQLAAAIAN